MQLAALRATDVIHRAGLGGAGEDRGAGFVHVLGTAGGDEGLTDVKGLGWGDATQDGDDVAMGGH